MNGSKILGIRTTHYGVDFSKYNVASLTAKVVDEIAARRNDPAQMLRWTTYAKEIDKFIPDLVGRFDKFVGDRKILFLGHGGSKNPLAAAAELMGKDLHDEKKIITAFMKPSDYRVLRQKVNNPEEWVVVVSSKSGKTPEIIAMLQAVMEDFSQYYMSKGKSPAEARALVNRQIMVVSDKNPEKSVLRKFAIANDFFDAREGNFDVPDGIGGRFSGLSCPYIISALRGAGASLKEILGFNRGVIKATENGLSRDFSENVAMQNALFWVDSDLAHAKRLHDLAGQVKRGELSPEDFSRMNLGKDEINLYVGSHFKKTSLYDDQFLKESQKTKSAHFHICPDDNHHAAESWFDRRNNNTFSVVSSANVGDGSLRYAADHYVEDSIVPDVRNYGNTMHTHIEDITPDGFAQPEAAGAYMTQSAFGTYDRGLLEQMLTGKTIEEGPQYMVLQPSVEAVKVSNQRIIRDYKERISNPEILTGISDFLQKVLTK